MLVGGVRDTSAGLRALVGGAGTPVYPTSTLSTPLPLRDASQSLSKSAVW